MNYGHSESGSVENQRMTERERDAIELLDRIYSGKAGRPLYDEGVIVEWIMDEIAAFIRKHGALPWILEHDGS